MQRLDAKSTNMISGKAIFVVLALLVSNCAFNNSISFFPFDAKEYDTVDIENIKVFNNRLEIGSKIEEIGILKVKGFPDIELIKEQAAAHGADGIVKDGRNYILVKISAHMKNDEGSKNGFSI